MYLFSIFAVVPWIGFSLPLRVDCWRHQYTSSYVAPSSRPPACCILDGSHSIESHCEHESAWTKLQNSNLNISPLGMFGEAATKETILFSHSKRKEGRVFYLLTRTLLSFNELGGRVRKSPARWSPVLTGICLWNLLAFPSNPRATPMAKPTFHQWRRGSGCKPLNMGFLCFWFYITFKKLKIAFQFPFSFSYLCFTYTLLLEIRSQLQKI